MNHSKILCHDFAIGETGTQIRVTAYGDQTKLHQIVIGKPTASPKQETIGKLGERLKQKLSNFFNNPKQHSKLAQMKLHEEGLPYQRSFHQKCMNFLKQIPLGETRSYKQQAIKAGTGPRVAGNANASNLFPLVIPCHRVIRSDGNLGGFMSGERNSALKIKQALIQHERQG